MNPYARRAIAAKRQREREQAAPVGAGLMSMIAHKKPKPVGELAQPLVAAAAVAFAMNGETKSEQKARLTDAYERNMITGAMLAELIDLHGLKEA